MGYDLKKVSYSEETVEQLAESISQLLTFVMVGITPDGEKHFTTNIEDPAVAIELLQEGLDHIRQASHGTK